MALRVWIIRKKIKGTKRKYKYKLRWEEPVLNEHGQHVLDDRGRPKVRRRQEATTSTDKVTVAALRGKKFREINGLEAKEEPQEICTLSQLVAQDEQWLRNRSRSEGTIYLSQLSLRHLQETTGDVPISSIGPEHIEKYIEARKAKVKAKTLARELGDLRAAFGRAVKQLHLLKSNPFAGIEKPRIPERQIRVLSPSEETKLLESCASDPELDLFVRLLFDTGARVGEIAHLRWEDLDLTKGLGRIQCTSSWQSKTRQSRPIAWADDTSARLAKWRLSRLGQPYVFDLEGQRQRGFYRHIQPKFAAAVKVAKLDHCTMHDIRRTVGTRLAEADVNQAVAAAYLGHADIRTTVKFYQKIRPEVLKETMLRMRKTGTS